MRIRIEHHSRNLLRSFFRINLCILFLVLLQGCQNGDSLKPGQTSDGFVVGNLASDQGTHVLFRSEDGQEFETSVRDDGSFLAQMKPGTYRMFIRPQTGALKLVKQSVVVEENMTVNVLEVSLVPIPQLLSVSAPLVYADSATVEWEADIESEGMVDYGTDASYGYSTYTDTEMKKLHRIQINGLNPMTRYHFRVVISRHGLDSTKVFSKDYEFTTDTKKE